MKNVRHLNSVLVTIVIALIALTILPLAIGSAQSAARSIEPEAARLTRSASSTDRIQSQTRSADEAITVTFHLLLNRKLSTEARAALIDQLQILKERGQVVEVIDRNFVVHVIASQSLRSTLGQLDGLMTLTDSPYVADSGLQPDAVSASGTLTGIVTADDGGAPLSGVEVGLYQQSPPYNGSSETIYTDGNGQYSVTVPAGSDYRLQFYPYDYHVIEWYNNIHPGGNYLPITITGGTLVKNYNASLAPGLQIKGRVTKRVGGTPLANINVYGYDQTYDNYFPQANTDANGYYTTTPGIFTATYVIRFRDAADIYAMQFYSNAKTFASGKLLTVTSSVNGINAALDASAFITGTITGTGGAPLSGIYIAAYFIDNGNSHHYAYTDVNGKYRLGGLADTGYKVWFRDYSDNYLTEYYNDKLDYTSATIITPTLGTTTTANAQLSQVGNITGTVKNSSNQPLAGISVYAYDPLSNTYKGNTTTSVSGTYRISQLLPGQYKVGFIDYLDYAYLTEYHNDKPTLANANVVTVTSGVTTTVNAQLALGGVISGTVLDNVTHLPISGVNIYYHDAISNTYLGGGIQTDAAGAFRIKQLPTGQYKLEFNDGSNLHVSDFYSRQLTLVGATPISVSANATTTILYTLIPYGFITGTIREQVTNVPLSTGSVDLYYAISNTFYTSANANASGVYRFSGLRAGSYKLYFYDSAGNHIGEYYNHHAQITAADWVTVSDGLTTTVDGSLLATGSITGTVRDSVSNLPLTNIYLSARDVISNLNKASYTTGASGQYTLTGLVPGQYKLYLYDNNGLHITEHYNHQPDFASGDLITITSRQTKTVNATMIPYAIITGTVTAQSGGAPIANIQVRAYLNGNSWQYTAYTSVTGTYQFSAIAGTYKLMFNRNTTNYVSEYYNNQPDLASGNFITVTSGQVKQINAQLQLGSNITGTVTEQGSGLPLNSVEVALYTAVDNSYTGLFVYTNITGTYQLNGLTPGQYKLRFYDTSGNHQTEYYNDKLTIESANAITVNAGLTSTNNAQLARWGVITGTVTDQLSSLPISGTYIVVYNMAGSFINSSYTNISGTYRLSGFSTADYKVQFDASSQGYLPEYFNHKASFNNSDPISITAGVTTTLNAQLTHGGSITGRVTDENTSLGIDNVEVDASRFDGPDYLYVYTDPSGYYTITGLNTGVYGVYFYAPTPHLYYNENYDNFRSGYGETLITVTRPYTTVNINARLRRGLMITGTVTGTAGPLQSVYVCAFRQAKNSGSPCVYTDAAGKYTLAPLEPDYYRIQFYPYYYQPVYALQWYSNSHSYQGAAFIKLTTSLTNVNAQLVVGGQITGTVTSITGTPLSNASVYAYTANNPSYLAYAYTDVNGQYVINKGLPTGQVQFYIGAPTGYASQWYPDQASQLHATPFTVTAGLTLTNINFQLLPAPPVTTPGGAITGTITASDTGLPYPTYVYAYNSLNNSVASAYASSGKFVITGLTTGTYRLRIGYNSAPYASYVWYNTKFDFSSATPIAVTPTMTVTNINQAIPIGSLITGTLSNGSTGIPGIQVYAQAVGNTGYSRSFYTGVDGQYALWLMPGKYQLQLTPVGVSPYISQWYSGTLDQSSAITIDLPYSTTIPNINQVLNAGTIITGVVTATDTLSPLFGAYAGVYSATTGFYMGYGYVDMNGQYQTIALPAGDYKLKFEPYYWNSYLPEYYTNQPDFASALTLTVSGAGVITNVNAGLDRGASVSGYIFDRVTGFPLYNASTYIYSNTGAYVSAANTNYWGFYQLVARVPGVYKTYHFYSNYKPQYYWLATTLTAATPVTLTSASDTPNISVYLRWPYESLLPMVLKNQ